MCSALDLSWNNLTGYPPALPPTAAASYAYNCLRDCTIARQPACPVCIPGGLTSADEVAVLTALYTGTNGAHWINSGGWLDVTLDPVCSGMCLLPNRRHAR